MAQQGAALQNYNNELVKCKIIDCFIFITFFSNLAFLLKVSKTCVLNETISSVKS